MALSKKYNLAFVHIPKCAGTSIIEAFKKVDETFDHAHAPWYSYRKRFRLFRPFLFSVVRNPWDRALSLYQYAIQENSFWHGKNTKEGIHPDYELLKNLSFKECLKLLHTNRHVLHQELHLRKNFKVVWSHQHPFIFKGNKLMVDKLFHFEKIDELALWLREKYGVELPHLNATSEQKRNYRDYYDPEMVKWVAEIYQEDIRLLGYQF